MGRGYRRGIAWGEMTAAQFADFEESVDNARLTRYLDENCEDRSDETELEPEWVVEPPIWWDENNEAFAAKETR